MDDSIRSLRRRVIEEKRIIFLKEAEIDKLEAKIQDVEIGYVVSYDVLVQR